MNTKVYKKYDVTLDSTNYELIIGRNIICKTGQMLLRQIKDKRVLIIIDNFFSGSILNSLIENLSQNGFETFIHLFEAGKQKKIFVKQ